MLNLNKKIKANLDNYKFCVRHFFNLKIEKKYGFLYNLQDFLVIIYGKWSTFEFNNQ